MTEHTNQPQQAPTAGDSSANETGWHYPMLVRPHYSSSQSAREERQTSIPSQTTIGSNSYRGFCYRNVLRALSLMGERPEGDSLFLDKYTVARARDLVGVLFHNTTLSPPKVMPHEGDMAVLTWDSGNLKQLISVEGEEIDRTLLNKNSFVRCSRTFEGDFQNQALALLKELDGDVSTTSG